MTLKDLIQNFHDSDDNGLHLVHEGLDAYPSFYYDIVEMTMYIKTKNDLSVLSHEIKSVEQFRNFFDSIIGMEYPH